MKARIDILIQLRTLGGTPMTRLKIIERTGKGRVLAADPVPRTPHERKRLLKQVERALRLGEIRDSRPWWKRLLGWF